MLLEVWQDSISMSSTLEPDLGSFASWWAASVDIWVWEDFLTYRWLWLGKLFTNRFWLCQGDVRS